MTEWTDFEKEMLQTQIGRLPDWFLQFLVQLANDSGVSTGVTLSVGGSLVAGQIISGKEYFVEIGKQTGRALGLPDEEGAKVYQNIIESVYEEPVDSEGKEAEEDGEEDGEEEEAETVFIHMKDVHVFLGPHRIPTDDEGVLWRGRLSEVAGFFLGIPTISQD